MSAVLQFFKTLDPKRKAYFNVFWGLCFLTVLELAFLHLPFSQVVITILICLASLAKAVIVGWVYMHLNHETKGLKIILLFPLFVAFFYAVFLIADSSVTKTRHAQPYVGEPARTFGPRRIQNRMVDDFGNTVVAPPAAAEEHQGEHEESAAENTHEAAAGATSSEALGEEHSEASSKSEETH